jgi:LysM repeat protein
MLMRCGVSSLRFTASCMAVLAITAGLTGCAKSPVDGPTWSLTGSRTMAPPAPQPVEVRPVYRGGRDPATGLAQPHIQEPAPRQASVEMAPLAPLPSGIAKPSALAPQKQGVSAAAPSPVSKTADGRTIIDVRPGDTLTGLATAHRVSVAGLMFTNNLRSPAVEPGMRLVLPPR